MMINSIETIIYTIYFMIPGFVISEIIRAFSPGKKRSDGEKVLVYLGYSILNLGLWYWLFLSLREKLPNNASAYWLMLLLLVLGLSSLTGCILGFFSQKKLLRKTMEKLKISVEDPTPTAWEKKFSEMKKGCFLTVCIDDGSLIRGSFFKGSMASSDAEIMDIYLREEYTTDEDGNWVLVENSDGIWISAKSIKWISFMPAVEEDASEE